MQNFIDLLMQKITEKISQARTSLPSAFLKTAAAVCLCAALSSALALPAFAEGSKDINDTSIENYKEVNNTTEEVKSSIARWVIRASDDTNSFFMGVRVQQRIKFYAYAGETVFLASSGIPTGDEEAILEHPDGSKEELQFTDDKGYIKTKTQEEKGPNGVHMPVLTSDRRHKQAEASTEADEVVYDKYVYKKDAVTGSYDAYKFEVKESGVYIIEFKNRSSGEAVTSNTNGKIASNYTRLNYENVGENNANYVFAYDVTVAKSAKNAEGGTEYYAQSGRVYVDALSTQINGRMYGYLYTVTRDGYVWRFALNGIEPNTFSMYSNARGGIGKVTNASAYHSVHSPISNYTSFDIYEKMVDKNNTADGILIVGPDNDVTELDSADHMFFNYPASDLPDSVAKTTAAEPGTVTYMRFDGRTESSEDSQHQFENATSDSTPGLVGVGGFFEVRTSGATSYRIVLDMSNMYAKHYHDEPLSSGKYGHGTENDPHDEEICLSVPYDSAHPENCDINFVFYRDNKWYGIFTTQKDKDGNYDRHPLNVLDNDGKITDDTTTDKLVTIRELNDEELKESGLDKVSNPNGAETVNGADGDVYKSLGKIMLGNAAVEGTDDRVFWNGRDQFGRILPVGYYFGTKDGVTYPGTIYAQGKGGEVHYPLGDVEWMNTGVAIWLENPPDSVAKKPESEQINIRSGLYYNNEDKSLLHDYLISNFSQEYRTATGSSRKNGTSTNLNAAWILNLPSNYRNWASGERASFATEEKLGRNWVIEGATFENYSIDSNPSYKGTLSDLKPTNNAASFKNGGASYTIPTTVGEFYDGVNEAGSDHGVVDIWAHVVNESNKIALNENSPLEFEHIADRVIVKGFVYLEDPEANPDEGKYDTGTNDHSIYQGVKVKATYTNAAGDEILLYETEPNTDGYYSIPVDMNIYNDMAGKDNYHKLKITVTYNDPSAQEGLVTHKVTTNNKASGQSVNVSEQTVDLSTAHTVKEIYAENVGYTNNPTYNKIKIEKKWEPSYLASSSLKATFKVVGLLKEDAEKNGTGDYKDNTAFDEALKNVTINTDGTFSLVDKNKPAPVYLMTGVEVEEALGGITFITTLPKIIYVNGESSNTKEVVYKVIEDPIGGASGTDVTINHTSPTAAVESEDIWTFTNEIDTGTFTETVWFDADGDGINDVGKSGADPNEKYLSGVEINIQKQTDGKWADSFDRLKDGASIEGGSEGNTDAFESIKSDDVFKTDVKGQYKFTGLLPGKYKITVTFDTTAYYNAPTHTSEGEPLYSGASDTVELEKNTKPNVVVQIIDIPSKADCAADIGVGKFEGTVDLADFLTVQKTLKGGSGTVPYDAEFNFDVSEESFTVNDPATPQWWDSSDGQKESEITGSISAKVEEYDKATAAENTGKISFKAAGTYVFKVTEQSGNIPGVTYSEQEYKLTFTAENDPTNPEKLKVTLTEVDGKPVSVNKTTLDFENTYASGDVTLTVNADGDGIPDGKKFDVTVNIVDSKNGNIDREFSYDGDVKGTIKNGGTITLSSGQHITISDLPIDCKVTFRETGDSAKGYDTSYSVDSAAKSSGTSCSVTIERTGHTAEFTNTFKSGGLSIEKVSNGGGSYGFTLEISGDNPAFKAKVTIGSDSVDFAYSGTGDASKTFNLTNGQTAEITGLPAGAEYSLTESDPGDEILTHIDKASGTASPVAGTIKQGATDSYTFYNSTPATVKLEGVKKLDGRDYTSTLDDGKYSFKIEAVTAGAPMPSDDTVENGTDGAISFGEIEFRAPGEYEYTITETENENSDKGVASSSEVWNVTVNVTLDDSNGYALTADTELTPKNGTESLDGGKFVFTNTYTPPELTITKTSDKTDVIRDDTVVYTVTVENTAAGSLAQNVVLTDDIPDGLTPDSSSIEIDGVTGATSSITDNKITVNLGDIPGGTTVTVEFGVKPIPHVNETKSWENTASVTYEDALEKSTTIKSNPVTVTERVGDITISKTVEDASTAEAAADEFTFTLKLDRTDLDGKEYTYSGSSSGTLTVNEDTLGTVTLKDGGNITVKALPAGTTVTVTESDKPGYSLEGANNIGLTVTGGGTETAAFINKRTKGSLTVTKNLSQAAGYDGDLTDDMPRKFPIKIKLSGVTVDDTKFICEGTYTSLTFDQIGDYYEAVINLADGESVTVTGIPTEAEYEVAEEVIPGFVSNISDGTGTIGTAAANITVNNIKQIPSAVDVNIPIKKTLVDGSGVTVSAAGKQFKFHIKPVSGNPAGDPFEGGADVDTASGSLNANFSDSFTKAGEYNYTVNEVNTDIPNVTYSAESCDITVKVSEEYVGGNYTGKLKAEIIGTAEFKNILGNNTLKISKTVAGKDGETDRLWHYNITLEAPENTALAESYSADKIITWDKWYEDNLPSTKVSAEPTISKPKDDNKTLYGSFELKHGESISITGLPEGVKYSVIEVDMQEHDPATSVSKPEYEVRVRTDDKNAEAYPGETVSGGSVVTGVNITRGIVGTLKKSSSSVAGTVTLDYTNECPRPISGEGRLAIHKLVTGAGDGDAEWTFEILMSLATNAPESDLSYAYDITGQPITEKLDFSKQPDGTYKAGVTIGNNDTVTVYGLNDKARFTVTETGVPDGYEVANSVNYEKIAGSTAEQTPGNSGSGNKIENITFPEGHNGITLTVTNELPTRSLTVNKVISGGAGDENSFDFTVDLDNLPENSAEGIYLVTDGGRSEITGKKASFTLKDGGQAIITGLPAGVSYKVTETNNDDYENQSPVSGVIADEDVGITFTNVRLTESASITKTVKNLDGSEPTGAQKAIAYPIAITLTPPENITLSGSYVYTVGGEPRTLTLSGNSGIIELKDGETAEISDLPKGTEIAVSETLSADSDYTSEISNTDNDFTVTNTYHKPSLTLEKSVTAGGKVYSGADIAPVHGGDKITYSVKISQNGDDSSVARSVTVTDILPDGLVLDEMHFSDVSVSGSEIIWAVGDLKKGDSKELRFTVTVPEEELSRTWENTAEAKFANNPDGAETVAASSSVSIKEAFAQLKFTKNVSDTSGAPIDDGTEFDFTLILSGGKLRSGYTVKYSDKTDPETLTASDYGTGFKKLDFALHSGESIVISGIDVETSVHGFTENLGADSDYTCDFPTLGTLVEGENAAEVKNTYHKPEITLTKTQTVNGAENNAASVRTGDEVAFTVTAENTGAEGSVARNVFIADSYPEILAELDLSGITVKKYDPAGSEITGYVPTLTASGGVITLEAGDLQVGEKIEISYLMTAPITANSLAWENHAEAEFSNQPTSGKIISGTVSGHEDVSSLTVSKTVTGSVTAEKFAIDITLTEQNGDSYAFAGPFPTDGADTLEFTSGSAEIYLGDGEQITVYGLPAGLKYAVSENLTPELEKNYTPVYSGEIGTLEKDLAGTVSIENRYRFPSVSITKTQEISPDDVVSDDPEMIVRPGSEIIYKIELINTGDNAAENVTVTDAVPSGLSVDETSISPSLGSAVFEPSGVITWTVGTLEKGTGATLTFKAAVPKTFEADGVYQNSASLTFTNRDPSDLTPGDSQTPEVNIKLMDMTVSKTVANALAEGDRGEFGFVVHLDSEDIFTAEKSGEPVEISDGSEFTLKDGESIAVHGIPAGIAYSIEEIDLDPDYTVDYISGSIVAQGEVSPDESKNSITVTNTYHQPEITLTKTQSLNGGEPVSEPLAVKPGDVITYHIVASSVGNSPESVARDVVIRDVLEHDFAVQITDPAMIKASVNGAPAAAKLENGSVILEAGDLISGSTAELSFDVTVPLSEKTSTVWSNTASVYYKNNPGGEISSNTVTVSEHSDDIGILMELKDIDGADADTGIGFPVTVGIYLKSGAEAVEPFEAEIVSESGTKPLTVVSGDVITLLPNEKLVVKNVPDGITVRASESLDIRDNYTAGADSYEFSGDITVAENSDNLITVSNIYHRPEPVITKYQDLTDLRPGGSISYFITFENASGDEFTHVRGVKISDILPADGLSFDPSGSGLAIGRAENITELSGLEIIPDCFDFTGGTLSFENIEPLESIEAGECLTFFIRMNVDTDVPGNFVWENSASAEFLPSSAVISSGITDTETVTSNTVSTGLSSLSIVKTVETEPGAVPEPTDMSRRFAFEISLTAPESYGITGYPYTIYRFDGSVEPGEFPISGGMFELANGDRIEIDGLPAGSEYELTEEHVDGFEQVYGVTDGAIFTEADSESGSVSEYSGKTVCVKNIRLKKQSLTVKKTVSGDYGDVDIDFGFTLDLSDSFGIPLEGSFEFIKTTAFGTETGLISTGGEFTLKDGESIEISGLCEGTRYLLNEPDSEILGYRSGLSGEWGSIGDHTENVEVINVKKSEAGEMRISLSVDGSSMFTDEIRSNEEFDLDVVIPGGEGLLYTVVTAGQPAPVFMSMPTADEVQPPDGESEIMPISEILPLALPGEIEGLMPFTGQLTLRHGETAIIYGVPSGAEYTVTQRPREIFALVGSYRITYTTVYDNDPAKIMSSGVTDPSGTTVTVRNEIKALGSLNITNGVYGVNRQFNFEITLDQPLTGQFGELMFENGRAHCILSDGETITISDLPAGTHYTVAENENPGYTVIISGAEGEIAEAETQYAVFTNYERGSLVISKTVSGYGDRERMFKFTVALKTSTGDPISEAVEYGTNYGQGGSFEGGNLEIYLRHGEALTLSGIPSGTAFEIDEPFGDTDGYKVYRTNPSGVIGVGETVYSDFENYKQNRGPGFVIPSPPPDPVVPDDGPKTPELPDNEDDNDKDQDAEIPDDPDKETFVHEIEVPLPVEGKHAAEHSRHIGNAAFGMLTGALISK